MRRWRHTWHPTAVVIVIALWFSVDVIQAGAAEMEPGPPESAATHPATTHRPEQPGAVRTLATEVLGDVRHIITSPLRLDTEGALIAGGVAAVVGGLIVADHDIQKWFQRNRTGTTQDFADAMGNTSNAILPLNAGLLGIGYVFRKSESGNKLLQTSLVALEAQALAGGLTHLTKFAVGRRRPNQDPEGNTYDPFTEFGRAFPSGHATQAFAFASVFSEQYGAPVAVVSYGLATLISLQRVHNNDHFMSDVVMGGVIGFVIGKTLVHRHTLADGRLSILPLDVAGGAGLSLRYAFR